MKFKATVTITCEIETTDMGHAKELVHRIFNNPTNIDGSRAVNDYSPLGYSIQPYQIKTIVPTNKDITITQLDLDIDLPTDAQFSHLKRKRRI